MRDADLVAPLQALADRWLQQQPDRAELLIGRWIGDVGKYAQV